jgi:hypothetical protein
MPIGKSKNKNKHFYPRAKNAVLSPYPTLKWTVLLTVV